MKDLGAPARALLETIAKAKGSDLETVRELLERSGSRIEKGTFTKLVVAGHSSLPRFDLRPFDALEEVRVNAVGWEVKATSLELGTHPKLRTLLFNSHLLTKIDLSGCTALVDLDLSYNQLSEVALPNAPLEILNLTDNPLRSLDVARFVTLERLEVTGAGLSSIDVAPLVKLRSLLLTENALHELELPRGAPMKTLSLSRIPLGRLDVSGYPDLETLFCDDANLTQLDLAHNPKLGHLSCENNKLAALDLRHNPHLRRLSAKSCGPKELDLRMLDVLTHLEIDDEVTLHCTERQKRAIPVLRKRFGLKAHKKIEDMDLWELDLVASDHNWDDGTKKLLAIAKHPRCDLGTALKIYWLGEPEEMAEWATPKDAPREQRAVVELLRTIEKRVVEKSYQTREVRFEGARETEAKIPREMHQKV